MLDLPGLWLQAEDRQLLRQPEVAGLILFARNTESPQQVTELVRAIRAERPDMLIAIDQEGGRVNRLPSPPWPPLPPSPPRPPRCRSFIQSNSAIVPPWD